MRHVQPIALMLCLAASFGPAARADMALLREATGLAGVAIRLSRLTATVHRERNSGAEPGNGPRRCPRPEQLVQGYGETTIGNGNEPDGRSLLRFGSVSKIFATALLAGMAAEGQPRLTDPLRQYAWHRSLCRGQASGLSPC